MVKKDVPLHELAIAFVIPGQVQPPLCMVATKDPFVKEDSWYVCDALVFDENDEEVTYTCKKVEHSFKAGEITMWSLQCIILAHMFDDSQPDIVAYMKMSQQKRASIAVRSSKIAMSQSRRKKNLFRCSKSKTWLSNL